MTHLLPTRQVPQVYHQRVGDMVVTSIGDGSNPFNQEMLQPIGWPEVEAMLRDAGRTDPVMTAVNTFLVQSAGRTVLIDTGCGALTSPTAGKMMENLAAAGVAPGAIDAVLLTHMHIDHIGGLLDASGAPNFPNAELLIPEAEAAYWLDAGKAAAAPEAMRWLFALAQKVATPYGNRVRRFTGSPSPGIEAVPLPGHSPGHTGYMVGTGADRLLIWGDIFHVPDVQSVRPDIYVVYDLDAAEAVASRKRALEMAASGRLLVAGMHMNFPGLAHIVRQGEGYHVQPIAWLPIV